MTALWFVGAPHPATWGSDEARRLFAHEQGETWCLIVERHEKYTAFPPHEIPVLLAVAPFAQVAGIVWSRIPDIERGLLWPLIEPHEAASPKLDGCTPASVTIGHDVFLGIARRGEAHTLFATFTGAYAVAGLVPGQPSVIPLMRY